MSIAGKGVHGNEKIRNHVLRQQVLKMGPKLGWGNRLFFGEIGQEQDIPVIPPPGPGGDQGFGHGRMTAQGLFDFSRFHPNTVSFDLVIFTANEFDAAIRTIPALIARAVDDIFGIRVQGVLDEPLGRQLGIEIISFGSKRRFDVNIAFFADGA